MATRVSPEMYDQLKDIKSLHYKDVARILYHYEEETLEDISIQLKKKKLEGCTLILCAGI